MGAIGLEPGDEVVVTPWTMVARTAILHWNAIPVFADIDPQTFNIDPNAVEEQLHREHVPSPRWISLVKVLIFRR